MYACRAENIRGTAVVCSWIIIKVFLMLRQTHECTAMTPLDQWLTNCMASHSFTCIYILCDPPRENQAYCAKL